MTTNQTERVSDEELDQMILKLERDGGMTPKMLSLMRELRELRMAKGDGRDQFEEWFKFHHGEEGSIVTLHRANGGANYADPHVDLAWIAWKDSRTAMLNHSGDTADMAEPVSKRDELNSPVTPDGWIPVSEKMPDPKSELRVCVYTPNPHEDIRYRFVPASLFKAVCRDATHWHYMSAPKEVG